MKKIKDLWGERRKIWREYKTAFLIEIIFLCVAITATGLLIRMSQKVWQEKLELMTKNVQNLVESNLDTRKAETRTQLKNNVFIDLKNILPDTGNPEWDSQFGLKLQFFGESDEVICELENTEVGCIWTSYDQETKKLKKEWISLKKCIEKSESSENGGMNSFQEFYRKQNGQVRLKKLKGYYNGNTFNVSEVQFQSILDENAVWNTPVASSNYKSVVCRVANLADVSEVELEDVTLEQGGIELFAYLPAQNVQYGLESQATKLQNHAEGRISGYNLTSYQIGIYADTFYLATHDGNLKNFTLPIWLIGQALAVLLIIVYLYLYKKRKELVSLRNTFINAMAHEMKTPAAVIKNSAECLEDGIHPEKRTGYISMIQKEADHMNQLLMSMLTYTRLSDSSYDLHMEKCSLQKMMVLCCDHYKEQIEKKSIQVIWDVTEEENAVCDKKMLSMVMDNFLSNAVRFCPSGGVIRLSVSRNYVSVYNEGIQIPDNRKKEIWTPMYLMDDSRTKTGTTSGMGLAISAIILKAHHAEYGVENVEGGVKFYFKLK
ncbi:HAMP domain-containing sensor histidine kinase [uncultured Eubacterium sp.]|uniref:sensor histidine kinase n=1 Tax=uncultured Eubacterium sp. TaxID=165185 RepID=UPI0025CBB39E|nr:HAMP domain-containing sensor histidine kinase [uncultured Eubacterium sp.]